MNLFLPRKPRVVVSCHVEQDKGADISYLPAFFSELILSRKKFCLLFLVNKKTADKILKIAARYHEELNKCCQLGLHFHDDDIKYLACFREYFQESARIVSFGHWNLNRGFLERCRRRGATTDMSYAAYRQGGRYFLHKTLKIGKVSEIPISCDPLYPVNPVTSWYHFILTLILRVLACLAEGGMLHVYFHSYDLYASRANRLRWLFLKLIL